MNECNAHNLTAAAPKRTIVAPVAELKKKLAYIPKKAVETPIRVDRTIIFHKVIC